MDNSSKDSKSFNSLVQLHTPQLLAHYLLDHNNLCVIDPDSLDHAPHQQFCNNQSLLQYFNTQLPTKTKPIIQILDHIRKLLPTSPIFNNSINALTLLASNRNILGAFVFQNYAAISTSTNTYHIPVPCFSDMIECISHPFIDYVSEINISIGGRQIYSSQHDPHSLDIIELVDKPYGDVMRSILLSNFSIPSSAANIHTVDIYITTTNFIDPNQFRIIHTFLQLSFRNRLLHSTFELDLQHGNTVLFYYGMAANRIVGPVNDETVISHEGTRQFIELAHAESQRRRNM